MSENCPKCGANRTQFEGQTSWECGSYSMYVPGLNPFWAHSESEHCKCRQQLAALTQRAERLTAACSKSNDEVCQIAGKALGYMWFKEDQKTFPGATEKTGVFVGEHVAETIVSELAKKFMDVVASEKRLREGIEGLSCCRVVIRDVMNELVDQEASGIRPHTCVDFDEQINGLLRLDRDIALLAQPSDGKEAGYGKVS